MENGIQLTRSDSEKLAIELCMSKEDARCFINENNEAKKRLDASKQTYTGPDNLAALLGLPVTEVEQLLRQTIEPALTAPEASNADMALALTLQEQSDLDAVRNDEAQQKMDAALSQQLSEPEFQCAACLDTFKVSEMFTLDCPVAHRLCFEDIRRHVEGRLERREVVACPLCSDPVYELSEAEVGTPTSWRMHHRPYNCSEDIIVLRNDTFWQWW